MSASTLPKVYINILVWNEYEKTKQCIESCEKINYQNVKILLIDNNSTNGCCEKLIKEYPWLSYVRNEVNLGYAGGNNVGLKIAMEDSADYIFILNNDIEIINGNIINQMVYYMEKFPIIGALGPDIYNVSPDGSRHQHIQNTSYYTFLKKMGLIKNDSKNIKLEELKRHIILFGAAWMLRTRCIKETGLFNQECFLYGEESDLCMRINNRNHHLYKLKAKDTIVLHHHYKTSDSIPTWIAFLMARNRFLALRQFKIYQRVFLALFITLTSTRLAFRMLFQQNGNSAKGTIEGVAKGWRILLRDILGKSKDWEYYNEAKRYIERTK